MNHKNRLSGVLLPLLPLLVALGGCNNRQAQAQEAYSQYQAAIVSGDLRQARRALATLVTVDDSNPDYWIELGKVSMQLSDYGAAYGAFQRANELNRGNAEVLTILTQLALRSGNLDVASENADQLELVSPNNPAVPLTKGYVALQRGDLAEADKQVAAYTAIDPYGGSGKVLKARIMLSRNLPEDAIALLREQISQQPSDVESLRTLASIYELREQWQQAAATLRAFQSYTPADEKITVRLIEADLRSRQAEAAANVTMAAIEKGDVDNLLTPWVLQKQQSLIADRLYEWAKTADVGRRIAVARFLTTTDRPERVIELTASEATLPVRPGNVVANALWGTALVRTGRASEGLSRLNDVLALDGTNREGLRGRSLQRSASGNHKGAVEDAQKLVAADGDSASARLLLAQVYTAAGDDEAAKRTLWQAFHDLGQDPAIFGALRSLVAKSDGPQAVERLSQEFYDKRSQQLTRSFA